MKILEIKINTKKKSLSKNPNDLKKNMDLEYAKKYVFKYIQNLNICTKNELFRFYYLTNIVLEILDKEDIFDNSYAKLCYQYEHNILSFSISPITIDNSFTPFDTYDIANIIKERARYFYFFINITQMTDNSIRIDLDMKVYNSDLPEIDDEVISNFNNLLN